MLKCFTWEGNKKIDSHRDWKAGLMKLPRQWRGISAKDYFLYSGSLPPTKKKFLAGIPGWDCRVLHRALETNDIEVVDASVVPTFHQNHDYVLAGETYSDSKWWEKKDIKEIRDEYFKIKVPGKILTKLQTIALESS